MIPFCIFMHDMHDIQIFGKILPSAIWFFDLILKRKFVIRSDKYHSEKSVLNKDKEYLACVYRRKYYIFFKILLPQFQLGFIVKVSGLLGQKSMVLFNGFDIQLSPVPMLLYNDIQK